MWASAPETVVPSFLPSLPYGRASDAFLPCGRASDTFLPCGRAPDAFVPYGRAMPANTASMARLPLLQAS